MDINALIKKARIKSLIIAISMSQMTHFCVNLSMKRYIGKLREYESYYSLTHFTFWNRGKSDTIPPFWEMGQVVSTTAKARSWTII